MHLGDRRQVERTPQVPAGYAAIGPPSLAASDQLGGGGQLAPLKYPAKALANAIVRDRKDVGSSKAKNQKHLHRPSAYTPDRDELLDDFFVAHPTQLRKSRNLTGERLFREVANRGQLRPREPRLPQNGVRKADHSFGGGDASRPECRVHPPEDGSSGLA